VSVYFRDDVDIYFARQQVFERLSTAKDDLPDGIEPGMGPDHDREPARSISTK
jgi:cobalt-zinc-cadmium resistance protein CzcA